MSETNPDQATREMPTTNGRRFRWFVDPYKGRLLLPVSGLWILGLDWILFSSNAVSLGIATPAVVSLGFLLGGAGTFFFQRRFGKDKSWIAALKAFVAGLVVGAPLPLAGTIIGGGVLLLSGLGNAKR